MAALALGAGVLIGRASVGEPSAASAPAAPRAVASASPSSVPLGPQSLQQTGATCSVQQGDALFLGVEVRNTSSSAITVDRLAVGLPDPGMTLDATFVGACGELNPPDLAGYGLAPQSAVWLRAKLLVQVPCPQGLPVEFSVTATDQQGNEQTIAVGGFGDLTGVPWSGCPAASPS